MRNKPKITTAGAVNQVSWSQSLLLLLSAYSKESVIRKCLCLVECRQVASLLAAAAAGAGISCSTARVTAEYSSESASLPSVFSVSWSIQASSSPQWLPPTLRLHCLLWGYSSLGSDVKHLFHSHNQVLIISSSYSFYFKLNFWESQSNLQLAAWE